MKEKLLRLGSCGHLAGVLCQPDRPDPSRPALLIPNTGLEHRVGPNRLHVEMARALAERGHTSLRLDLSGMGDSSVQSTSIAGHVIDDQRAAMDELERRGIARSFVAIGLCSGANDIHWLAREEPRVAAAAFIDHYAYPTWQYRVRYVLQRLAEPRRVRNWLERKRKERSMSEKERFRGDRVEYVDPPPRESFQEDLDAFMRRRLPLFFLYTGEYQHLYNYREQLMDAFPSLRRYDACELHYMARCDHTFTQVAMREALVERLAAWLERFVAPPVRIAA